MALWYAYELATGTPPDRLKIDDNGYLTIQRDADGYVTYQRGAVREDIARATVIEKFGDRIRLPFKAITSIKAVDQ